jgi:hypothetical protein
MGFLCFCGEDVEGLNGFSITLCAHRDDRPIPNLHFKVSPIEAFCDQMPPVAARQIEHRFVIVKMNALLRH